VENTAVGDQALIHNTGNFNTAIGFGSLLNNTSGSTNTAVGDRALLTNTVGTDNAALGRDALFNNTTGAQNTAIGKAALSNNTTGPQNTAIGTAALSNNTTGPLNTAIGVNALVSNNEGDTNTAVGANALEGNTTGGLNIAAGFLALHSNTTGVANTAVGERALLNNTTGSLSVALGALAGRNVVTANNVICIGNGVAGADVIGTTWIGNIFGRNTQNGTTAPVVVSADGQLGTVASSERFKKDIAAMEKTSEAILSLRPVTFLYKTDTKGIPQFGLIAEEVAKVNPALVLPDNEGKPFTVRYDAVNAMLLNEFLKEHRKNEEQQATITELKSTVAQQQKDFQAIAAKQQNQIEALTAGLQKVSARLAAASPSRGGLEGSKFATGRIRGGGPAPQVVNNP
jgi:uncharacterized coiled-coil protein SlyX